MAAKFPLFVQLKAIDNISRPLDKATKRIDKFGKKIQGIGRKISTNLSLPAGLAAGGIFKVAGDFEESFNRLRALKMDAPANEIDNLRKRALELGRSTRYTASEVTEGMNFLAMAGLSTAQILEGIGPSLQIATIAQMDLAESADIVTNVMSGFRIESSQLTKVNDIMAKTIVSANTNLRELAEGMKMVAPVATAAGFSLEEVSTAMGVLGSSGIKGEMAGTGLARVIETLIAKGVKVTSFRDLIKAMASDTDAARMAMEAFGKRGGRTLLALGNAGEEEFNALMSKIQDAEGTAAKMNEIMDRGAKGGVRRMMSALEGLAIAIGDSGLLAGITSVIEGTATWVQGLSETSPWLLKVAGGALIFAAVLGPLVAGIGFMTIGIAAAIPVLKTFFLLMVANPIGLIITGAVLLALLLRKLTKNMSGFWDVFFGFGEAVGAAMSAIGNFLTWIWESFTGIFTKIGDFISDLIPNALKRAWNAVPDWIKSFLKLPTFKFDMGGGDSGNSVLPRSGPDIPERGILETRTTRVEKQEAAVKVTFDNLPPGATVRPEGRPEIPLRLDTGYSMAY